MAWTAPRTWVTGELVTASVMNTHIKDNLTALSVPNVTVYNLNQGSNYTTTSGTLVDIDGTNLALALAPTWGYAWSWFHGTLSASGGTADERGIALEIDRDGNAVGGDDGIISIQNLGSNERRVMSFLRYIGSLATSSQTFSLQWMVNTDTTVTGTLYAGAGTTNLGDVHPQFGVAAGL